MTTNAHTSRNGLSKLSKRPCITDGSEYKDDYTHANASSICSIRGSSCYELARLYSVKQTIFTISSFATEGFVSGESFESSTHRIFSISQTFHSWAATFHLRQPIAFLSHSSYGMPGLAFLIFIFIFTNFMTFIPSLAFTELWVVSMEHLQRVWLASRERLPFRTPGSVAHFGTC